MQKQQLTAAAWCSVVHATVSVPSIIVGFLAEKWTLGWLLDFSLTVLTTALWLYSSLTLRSLLAVRGAPSPVLDALSRVIWVGLAGIVFLEAIDLLPLSNDAELAYVDFALVVVTFLVVGGLSIAFANRLLRMPDELFGLQKPFGYTALAGYICCLSCVFIPIGIAVLIANDVIQAMIFSRAASAGPLPSFEGGRARRESL